METVMPDTDKQLPGLSRPVTLERAPAEAVVLEIHESLRGLRFGTVQIIVQDGVVVQIDRTEKRRLRTRRGD
jgi:hypothetical protein